LGWFKKKDKEKSPQEEKESFTVASATFAKRNEVAPTNETDFAERILSQNIHKNVQDNLPSSVSLSGGTKSIDELRAELQARIDSQTEKKVEIDAALSSQNVDAAARFIDTQKNKGLITKTTPHEKTKALSKEQSDKAAQQAEEITRKFTSKVYTNEILSAGPAKPVVNQKQENLSDNEIMNRMEGFKNKGLLTDVAPKQTTVQNKTTKEELDELDRISGLVSGFTNSNMASKIINNENNEEESAE